MKAAFLWAWSVLPCVSNSDTLTHQQWYCSSFSLTMISRPRGQTSFQTPATGDASGCLVAHGSGHQPAG